MFSHFYEELAKSNLTRIGKIELEKVVLTSMLIADSCVVYNVAMFIKDITRLHLAYLLENNKDCQSDELLQLLKKLNDNMLLTLEIFQVLGKVVNVEKEQGDSMIKNIPLTQNTLDDLRTKIMDSLPDRQ